MAWTVTMNDMWRQHHMPPQCNQSAVNGHDSMAPNNGTLALLLPHASRPIKQVAGLTDIIVSPLVLLPLAGSST